MRRSLAPITRLAALLATLLATPLAYSQSDAPEQPARALPYTPGLDVTAMDRSVDPCEDFYQYSCGGWMKNNPIPADQASWSVYGKLAQDNQRYLWGILDELAQGGEPRSARQKKLGDYFAACMNEAAIESLGAAPIQPLLAQIDALRSKRELPALLAQLHQVLAGNGVFFDLAANSDFSDVEKVIAFVSAAGLSLPDRDYYLKHDRKSVQIRSQFLAHVARSFVLLGDTPAGARANARRILAHETDLARATLTRVDLRDPHKLNHPMNGKRLQALTPHIDWRAYLAALGQETPGLAALDAFNVTEPRYLAALDRQVQRRTLADLKTILRWQVVHAAAPTLSSAFVNEDFAFFAKTLHGVPQLKPRWKRCVALVDAQLGEALGEEFVSRTFSPERKADTLRMTRQIESAMQEDIEKLPWMSAATKQRALEKLHSIVNKIGYPDTWRDYGALTVQRDDFAGNVLRGNAFESRRDLAKIGKPLDRGEWGMTPPTVNAYYNPQMNDINFPAGVLQPPLYDPAMDDAPNYGNTGATIAHELTHGFDDEGRHFDAKGNLKEWWTPQDDREFSQRAQCIVDQYAQYTVVDDIKINSRLTLGEDIADLGGLLLGWMAWQTQSAANPPAPRDGMTPEQRFFVGYAQWACENNRPEDLRNHAMTDPHSPGKYRVNGLVANMPEFTRAFSCKPGQAMVRENRCRIW